MNEEIEQWMQNVWFLRMNDEWIFNEYWINNEWIMSELKMNNECIINEWS